jgi:hypothetical protein
MTREEVLTLDGVQEELQAVIGRVARLVAATDHALDTVTIREQGLAHRCTVLQTQLAAIEARVQQLERQMAGA